MSLSSTGSSFVAYDNALGSFRAINYGTDSNSVLSPGGSATIATGATVAGGGSIATTSNVQLTGSVSAQTAVQINTLNITGSTNITQVGGTYLTLTAGGILKSGGGSSTISGGLITTPIGSGAAGTLLTIRTDMATDQLTIASSMDNTMTGGLDKLGAGTLILSGTNSYIGSTAITGGTLYITGDSSGDSASTYFVDNGVLEIGSTGLTDPDASVQLGYTAASTTNGVLELGDAGGAANMSVVNLTSIGTALAGDAVIGNNAANSTLTINQSLSRTILSAGQSAAPESTTITSISSRRAQAR